MNRTKKTIIIIGSGKAALLHINAYISLWNTLPILLVVIVPGDVVIPELFLMVKKYNQLLEFKSVQQVKNEVPRNSMIDVCTPTEIHRATIEEMVNMGFTNFVVEKPLVTNINELNWVRSLNISIEVVQNYLFSKATQFVVDYIKSQHLKPISMLSFFCKDRRSDTARLRGFCDNIPPNIFTIEFPHQIYLATTFLGPGYVTSSHIQSLNIGGTIYLNSGAGSVKLIHPITDNNENEPPNSLHFSCMHSKDCIKRIQLFANDGLTIIIDYPDNNDIQTSRIRVQKGDKDLHQVEFHNDNMMMFALKHYFNCIFSKDYSFIHSNKNNFIDNTKTIIDAITSGKAYDSNDSPIQTICESCKKTNEGCLKTLPCEF